MIDSSKGIAGLKGALRYVRAYRDQTFVVKLGGDVLKDPTALDHVAGQLALLHSLGIRLVVVHGGGPQASDLQRRLGYTNWRRFEDAVRRAMTSCEKSGNEPRNHFDASVKTNSGVASKTPPQRKGQSNRHQKHNGAIRCAIFRMHSRKPTR